MNFFSDMIASPGFIFGPAMMFAGIAALVICLRATWKPARPRRIVLWAVAPLAIGIVGALLGGIIWLSDKGAVPPEVSARGLMALGYTILFGLLVSLAPLMWSGLLLRRRA